MNSRPSSLPLALLLLAACPDDGGSGDTSTGPSSSNPTNTNTVTATATDTSEPTTDTPTTNSPTTADATTNASATTTPIDTTTGPGSTTTDTSASTTDPSAGDTTTTTSTTGSTGAADTGSTGAAASTGGIIDCTDEPGKLAGNEVVIAPEFMDLYTTYELGPVPGIPPDARLGGCVISFDDPNILLIAGYSEATNGQLYKIGVERGNCDHIVAFTGQATSIANTPYIDANLIYVKSGLLFYSEWPVNNLSQLLPGGNAPARTTALGPLGVANSIGGIGFVPPGFVDAGGMRLLSWPGGEWYHLERDPDGELFVVSKPVKTATLPNGPGGFAYVPKGSPGFDVDHVIVSEWSTNTVGVYQVDAQGDPKMATRKDFYTTFPRPWGAYFEPLTGDFMFLTWGAGVDRVYIVQGFKAPPPLPQ
ncbi:MAG: hypothetical protein IPO88_03270 [Nannocystis sp.]|uniref:hypothetical protein n=1 Tax=Nannocystis sp. TaxID=1962667 RepID=UPI0024295477|nr:hypothetical protein [Nannocystis sp.]MBK9752522.1 hypothetical protein [Nannocystis sp.]